MKDIHRQETLKSSKIVEWTDEGQCTAATAAIQSARDFAKAWSFTNYWFVEE